MWTLTGAGAAVRPPLPEPAMLAGDTAVPSSSSEMPSSAGSRDPVLAPKQRLQITFSVGVRLTQLPSSPVDFIALLQCVSAGTSCLFFFFEWTLLSIVSVLSLKWVDLLICITDLLLIF